MTTWKNAVEYQHKPIGITGWLRVILRAVPLILLICVCLLLLLSLRLLEKPIYGMKRPFTPHITQFVCKNALRILRIKLVVHGQALQGQAAVVANHTSWLDIFALNASKRIYFVSKSEVANWPGIGALARATGTFFIKRERAQAHIQTQIMSDRLKNGHKLLFFPEGTSTDGQQVLPFKTTLFASFMSAELRDTLQVQPVSVFFHPPKDQPKEFYGWWGDMDFASHLLATLAAPEQGRVEVMYHPPLHVVDFEDRKTLARAAEEAVRNGHDQMKLKG